MSLVSEPTPEGTASPPTTSPAPGAPPARRSAWKGLALRMHFYAGLLVGPFILVAAVTGVLYALAPQLESWIYDEQLHVPTTSRQLPLADQVAAALATNPAGTLDAVRPAPGSGDTTRVLFTQEGLGESERWTVFVDPGTAEVRGELVTYGTSGVLPLRMTLDQLHRNLLLGEPGRLYSELAASWLWVVALGGLVLWIARWRARRVRRPADLVLPERGVKGRRRLLGRHGALGVWLLLGMLFLSATGLTWSTYAGAGISDIRAGLGWSTPSLDTGGGDHAGHGGGAPGTPVAVRPGQFDSVLTVARGAGIDARQVEVGVPAEAGGPWTVTEVKRSWPTQVDAMAIDAGTGTVVDEVRFADYPFMAKLARWGIDAHMGTLFGVANQVVLVAFGIGLVTVILLGYRMWWVRRPDAGRPAPLVGRGQFRTLSQPVGFAVVLAAVAIGWLAPLFGLSLLAFLLVDAWRGYRAAQRGPAAG